MAVVEDIPRGHHRLCDELTDVTHARGIGLPTIPARGRTDILNERLTKEQMFRPGRKWKSRKIRGSLHLLLTGGRSA